MSGYPERLERGYRRLLAWYPRAFRRDSEDEIIGVLLATAPNGQQRVGLAESADLIRGALRMRLRPPARRPRTVAVAVRLMVAGALAELATLITVVATTGAVRTAIEQVDPGQWHIALLHITMDEVAAPVAVAVWLVLALAVRSGRDWARFLFLSFFGVLTLGTLAALAQGAAVYAPADMLAGGILWLIALAATVLIFTRQSAPYYQREPARL